MPKVEINGVGIYYELDGTGEETVVLLNGIMMSTASWVDCVDFYTRNGYRLLRVDFRDQGQSDKCSEQYEIGQHVEDLRDLFVHLGLPRVHLVGTSYGGQVALLFALKYGYMLKTLILANTSARLTNHLKAIGEAWDEAVKLNSGQKFLKLAMPFIYSSTFYEAHYQWLKAREKNFGEVLTSDWFAAYLRLSSSHGGFDILERLGKINVPTLLIGAEKDMVTPLEEMIKIHRAIKGSLYITIPEAGHASFYEKKEEFHTAILGFLALSKAR
ncbi:Alpha/Beta hydrolase fold [Moorella glycerini]|uniref:Non-heme bromoperoxidase BpoC n=1 Tax=Neomoorella stamsii TaxID=1266720 RepID=A0A9X7P5A9_9FIRM|nr:MULTISPECIES: alpha/beta hydrolase [Moorella]PRR71303.1 putative non-heme bromoperoxidase BpoC [Moorella stamsii]CEP66656.1 Alpha/Beta hydrolase fold [Moorella glycerini]